MRLIIYTLTAASVANAAGGAHSDGVPSFVLWQVINLTILGAILYKYGKQPIVDLFKQRQSDYLKQAEKSKALFLDAEKEYSDIKNRLESLTNTADQSLEKAKKDATDIKTQMLLEAKATSQRIKDEAQTTARIESQRALNKIRSSLVESTMDQSKAVLTKDIGGQDHLKLQTDFTKNIEAVSP